MEIQNRQKKLFIVVGVMVGLYVANSWIYEPLTNKWLDGRKQIKSLKDEVDKYTRLNNQKYRLQKKWQHMKDNALPADRSQAGIVFLQAKDRWEQTSGVKIDEFSPQIKNDEDPDTREPITTLECRTVANGNMRNLLGFLFAVENDPMGVKLEDVDISSKDSNGQQLSLGLTMSGLVLGQPQQSAAPTQASQQQP